MLSSGGGHVGGGGGQKKNCREGKKRSLYKIGKEFGEEKGFIAWKGGGGERTQMLGGFYLREKSIPHLPERGGGDKGGLGV